MGAKRTKSGSRPASLARYSRVAIALLLVFVCAAVATVAIELTPLLRVAENSLADVRLAAFTPPQPQDRNIVVITVDDDTLRAVPYRSPLDRELLSELLVTLQAKGVIAIGLNVLIDRPTETRKDEMLRLTLQSMNIPVVLASLSGGDGVARERKAYADDFAANYAQGLAVVFRDRLDETVRHVLVRREGRGADIQLGFAAAVANVLGQRLPLDNRLMIDYRVPPDINAPAFPVYSAHAVADLPEENFRGRIALIGSNLDFVGRHRTPASATIGEPRMPGVLIEAHALSQILEGRSVEQVGLQGTFALSLIAAMLGLVVAVLRAGLWWRVVLAIVLLPMGWMAIFYAYVDSQLLLPIVAPTLAFALAAGGSFTWQWRIEYTNRRYIHGAFGRFLAPTVVDQLINNPRSLDQSGEMREITFLFTDVADFTALTESNPPDQLVRLLNEYLDHACRIVIEHGGTIDKIVGDALHVMFNAPITQQDHAQRAVDCALALDSWAHEFAIRKHGEGMAMGVTRIGVNTGQAVVGNFGGGRRFDYTAHGDAVNTAARLEGVNKRLGTRICISKTTVDQCDGVEFRSVGELVLRGKTVGVHAHTPLTEFDDPQSPMLQEYEDAFQLLAEASPRAGAIFIRLRERYPEDPLIKLHYERMAAGETDARIVIRRK